MERTLIVLKPDAVVRQLTGTILSRFEQAGLKIVAMKMVWIDRKTAHDHYPLDEEWAKNVYEKSKKVADASGKKLDFANHVDFGKNIQGMLVNFLTQGPVVAAVLEGTHAVEAVRKLVGSTEPRQSIPGTIRGDFASTESYANADSAKRAVMNLVHASDSVDNARREIAVWFTDKEIHTYKTATEHYYGSR